MMHRKFSELATTKIQAIRVLIVFGALLSVFLLYAKFSYTRDPSSYFFDRHTAYEPLYSARREEQALSFIHDNSENRSGNSSYGSADNGYLPPPQGTRHTCLGIMTIQRHGPQHFPSTIGSLLEGLTPTERDDIHLISFFADLEPEKHDSFNEGWVESLSDRVLTRRRDVERVQDYAGRKKNRQKATLDYRYLLEECYAAGTSYIAIVEDDIIAARGWYQRTIDALEELDARSGAPDWLYLRLFYTEQFLGWNSDEWNVYLTWIVPMSLAVFLGLIVAKKVTNSSKARVRITNSTISVAMCICVPLTVAAYFLAGRMSMQPLPHGLVRMDQYGCCSQGLVYDRERVPAVIEALDPEVDRKLYPDEKIERLAERQGLARWALVPSVFQHVGKQSGDGKWLRVTWNFEFETSHDG